MELGTFVVVDHRGHPLNHLVGKIVGKRGDYAPGDPWCLVFVINRGRSYLIRKFLSMNQIIKPRVPYKNI